MHDKIDTMENSAEKQEKSISPSVAIDGSRVRNIRETYKLTQLYVANVVGVTTDTISRWENNRYPTIKRDNAEKLATALDVELAEILKSEETPAAPEEPPLPHGNRRMRFTVLLIGVVLVITATALFFRHMATHPIAVRKLPHFGAPGEVIPVQIRVTRNSPDSAGFILKERLPDGWRLVASSPPAPSGQPSLKEVKWLVPAGSGQITISYTAQITPTAPLKSDAAFTGSTVSSAEGFSRTENVDGDRIVKVAGVHWADSNGDGRIDDDEIMPAYYLTEEMKGLGLDWKTIEAIWNARGYLWDRDKKEFTVVR
jgi:transcriptional regulator with XRE-family HTH domain